MNSARSARLKFAFVMSLTLGRIPLILIFFAVNLFLGAEKRFPFWFTVAFAAMVLSALTDLFDGYFARRFKMETKLGAYADPMMDKVFYIVTLPILIARACLRGEPAAHTAALAGLTVLFLSRDQWVSFLRQIGALYGVDAKADWSGKARTVLAFPTICAAYWFLEAPRDWLLQVNRYLLYTLEWACLALTVLSSWTYTRRFWPCVRKELAAPLERIGAKEQTEKKE